MLLDYCRKIANKYNIAVVRVRKFVPNISNKNRYVLHYRNL